MRPPTTREVPVLLLVFNRPTHTAQVFQRIRELRPVHLLISADGPRQDFPDDHAACLEVRKIVSHVDWDCTVSTHFRDSNLGCRYGPAAGLDWAFQQVDHAIILEDDCLPDYTFFRYCAELLWLYREEEQVMSIGGHRWEGPDIESGDSYYFSRYPATWGWATWSNRWSKFDIDMDEWIDLRTEKWLEEKFRDTRAVNYWRRIFDSMVQGLDAWDYAWLFACWRADGLSIRPNTNLVTNVGFGSEATHTQQAGHPASRPASHMKFPLEHPDTIGTKERNEELIEWVNFSGVVTRQVREGARQISARRKSYLSSNED
jgi:hypothetical protein